MASLQLCVLIFVMLAGLGSSHKHEEGHKHFHCTKEGRFADPEDCGRYIDCIPDVDTGLLDRPGSCHGLAYDQDSKKCVDLHKVIGCKPRKSRSLASDPKLSYVCDGAELEFVCADCKTLVNCVNGTAYPEPCGHGDFCAFKNTEFGGGVCYPNEPEECTCKNPNSFMNDVYDDNHFLFCEKEESDPHIYQCPEDHFFDPKTSQCKNYKGLPECEKIGVFADASNCTTFYTCIFTTTGWVQKPFSCNNGTSNGLMFNEGTGRCEDPCEWDDGEFVCETEGRFSDPLSCERYYECIYDPSVSEYRRLLHECPEDYVWDPTARNDFGHCVLAGTSLTPCLPHKPEKCLIPDGYCAPTTEETDTIPTDKPLPINIEQPLPILIEEPLPILIEEPLPILIEEPAPIISSSNDITL